MNENDLQALVAIAERLEKSSLREDKHASTILFAMAGASRMNGLRSLSSVVADWAIKQLTHKNN